MMSARTCCLCVVLVSSFVLPGCDSGPALTEVQGTVTYRGKALDHGMVSFFPASGRPVPASIQTDGKYSVELAPGSYGVIVVAPPRLPEGFKEGDPLPPPDPNAVPSAYNRKETSGLTATVEADAGTQQIDFALK